VLSSLLFFLHNIQCFKRTVVSFATWWSRLKGTACKVREVLVVFKSSRIEHKLMMTILQCLRYRRNVVRQLARRLVLVFCASKLDTSLDDLTVGDKSIRVRFGRISPAKSTQPSHSNTFVLVSKNFTFQHPQELTLSKVIQLRCLPLLTGCCLNHVSPHAACKKQSWLNLPCSQY
jgi:hypothetical protein